MDEKEKPIPSPCINNCCLNNENVCLGCFRHESEIIEWADSDNAKRKRILANCERRKAKHNQDRAGD